jgi:hypothetical protein
MHDQKLSAEDVDAPATAPGSLGAFLVEVKGYQAIQGLI